MLKLSEQDAAMLIAALEKPATTNEKLKAQASRYQAMCCEEIMENRSDSCSNKESQLV